MKPIKPVTIPQGVPVNDDGILVYLPLFDPSDIGKMDPELQLEKIRAFHCAYGQYDILEAIDKDVEERGNPYVGKKLWPPEREVKSDAPKR